MKHIKVKVQKLETKSKLRNSVRWQAPVAETLSVKEEPWHFNRQNLEFASKVSVLCTVKAFSIYGSLVLCIVLMIIAFDPFFFFKFVLWTISPGIGWENSRLRS